MNSLKYALAKGKTIIRIKNKNNKQEFLAISKVSKKNVSVYVHKKSEKIPVNSLGSYLKKKKFRFSGIAILYNMKHGDNPSTRVLKSKIGI